MNAVWKCFFVLRARTEFESTNFFKSLLRQFSEENILAAWKNGFFWSRTARKKVHFQHTLSWWKAIMCTHHWRMKKKTNNFAFSWNCFVKVEIWWKDKNGIRWLIRRTSIAVRHSLCRFPIVRTVGRLSDHMTMNSQESTNNGRAHRYIICAYLIRSWCMCYHKIIVSPDIKNVFGFPEPRAKIMDHVETRFYLILNKVVR